jgi:4-hydroxyphenylpyruvate dioxygenase-like putative hemolysin
LQKPESIVIDKTIAVCSEQMMLDGRTGRVAIDRVLAGIAVDGFASALTWYEQLFDRSADAAPMEGLAEFQGTPGLVKAATVTDPEGNEINFAEDLTNKN